MFYPGIRAGGNTVTCWLSIWTVPVIHNTTKNGSDLHNTLIYRESPFDLAPVVIQNAAYCISKGELLRRATGKSKFLSGLDLAYHAQVSQT